MDSWKPKTHVVLVQVVKCRFDFSSGHKSHVVAEAMRACAVVGDGDVPEELLRLKQR